ncbi:YhgE/Pip N-terminal domain protein [Thermoanaerobacter italicus Ab9]|uniref:YhgE/Pip N-terminal domain protein n=1 Tax=Thermoanaerobacter italicus (strain DSM 9252 / Ab9) TaxID=580331 RepID=D3T589_THEIA|nr:YhgE/Pip domain-containing protein [Thermoanaerobacter italicus]ADD01390.1 YhgE/Pip N-terminal domain protein [Thermoanaerobacter italicus Ab9]
MKAFEVAAKEIEKIIKSRFIRVAVIVVAFMPLLYSFLYLYAFWDPYSKLDKLPVAVVNEDRGGVYNGKQQNFGNEVVQKLKNNKEFKWDFVDYKKGIDGVKGKKYYFMIVIPEDFTQNITSVDSSTPKKATIEYITNDKKNFLATQIGNKAIESLQTEIANSIRKGYIDALFKSVDELGSGLKEASEAENKLATGTLELYNGARKLNENMSAALDGSKQIKDGVLDLRNGLNQALNGSTALYNGASLLSQKFSDASNTEALLSGMNSLQNGITGINQGLNDASNSAIKLKDGINSLVNGYNQVGQNVSSFADSISQLGSGLSQISTALDSAQVALKDYIAKHPEASSDPELQKVLIAIAYSNAGIDSMSQNLNSGLTKVQQLNTALAQLQEASNTINNGMDSLASGLSYMSQVSSQLVDGSNKLYSGVAQLSEGINTAGEKLKEISRGLYSLNNGIKSLSDGSSKLYNGANSLYNGMVLVKDGTGQLADGAKSLYDNQTLLTQKLNEAAEKIRTGITTAKKDMINEPIILDTRRLYPVKNYGIGFAPYFIPLSLWVGSLILFFLIDIFDKEKYEGMNNVSIQLGKFMSLALVGMLQSLVSSFVLVEGLKLDVHNLFYYYLINAVMSLTFIAIIQLFVMLFGIAGKFFAVVLLMLQLTSSGGTFPMELLPKFFNVINPYLPMTYGVAGLREAISGNNISAILHNISIIAGFGVLFLVFIILLAEKADKMEITQRLKQI